MKLTFKKTSVTSTLVQNKNTVYLMEGTWDDYSFKTTFNATLYDESGVKHSLGQIKIGYVDQPQGRTADSLDDSFEELSKAFFSLGQSVDYYAKVSALSSKLRRALLTALRDVVFDEEALSAAKDQQVFKSSFLRSINLASVSTQFKRILSGGAVLTPFHFTYQSPASSNRAGFSLEFEVFPESRPSQNIHVLIGRNGIGKTTLLNGMIATLTGQKETNTNTGQFIDASEDSALSPISSDYFAGLVSVSFSAFDSFVPPPDSGIDNSELKYSYIGLKLLTENGSTHKNPALLSDDFVNSLVGCFGLSTKRERWHDAIRFLESDRNFEEMDLTRLLDEPSQDTLKTRAKHMFLEQMSSGHAIVLLSITKLVERAEEKTLIILDEPESHLHPPLLSAFTRALADLLNKINGVAIIATHSPVVLQEVPKSCVWKIYRSKLSSESLRPEMETYGENVGTLTREVFGLEVKKSGFYDLLTKSVAKGKDYEQTLGEYGGQLGFEGRSILRALISNRDRLESAE